MVEIMRLITDMEVVENETASPICKSQGLGDDVCFETDRGKNQHSSQLQSTCTMTSVTLFPPEHD